MSYDQSTHDFLSQGEFLSCELTPDGSNYTFLSRIRLGEREGFAIYKPRDGEVPLWDFPSGTLYKREYAAYLLSEILEWDFIPLTIIRDGPYGIGSVQHFIEHNPRENYYTLDEAHHDVLRMIACYDLVANNTDRKAGHIIMGNDGKLWASTRASPSTPTPRYAPASGTSAASPSPSGTWRPSAGSPTRCPLLPSPAGTPGTVAPRGNRLPRGASRMGPA